MTRALFLDRDGILDELVYYPSSGEWESPRTLDDLVMLDVADALQRFADAGWLLIVITNQPSAAKGKATREALQEVQDFVVMVDGRQLVRERREGPAVERFVAAEYPLPGELTQGQDSIRVRFETRSTDAPFYEARILS